MAASSSMASSDKPPLPPWPPSVNLYNEKYGQALCRKLNLRVGFTQRDLDEHFKMMVELCPERFNAKSKSQLNRLRLKNKLKKKDPKPSQKVQEMLARFEVLKGAPRPKPSEKVQEMLKRFKVMTTKQPRIRMEGVYEVESGSSDNESERSERR